MHYSTTAKKSATPPARRQTGKNRRAALYNALFAITSGGEMPAPQPETEAEIIKARRARWKGAQDCWQKFADAFLVGKRNFLFEGGDEGILNSDTVKEVIARYDSLRGKNREADFIDAAIAAYSGASRPEKLVFAHALFIYKLIVKPKTVNEENIGKKQNFVNCLNLGDFVGDLHWNGVAHTGQTCNECSVSVDYILKALKHLTEKSLESVEEVNAEIRGVCEEQYNAKEKGAKWMVDILLWYVAPDEYEPIISREAKEKIVKCPEFIEFIQLQDFKNDHDAIHAMAKDEFKRNKVIQWIRQGLVKFNRVDDKKFNFYDSDVKRLWFIDLDKKILADEHEQRYLEWLKSKVFVVEKTPKTLQRSKKYLNALKSGKSPMYALAKKLGLIDGVNIHTLLDIRGKNEFESVKKTLESHEKFVKFNTKSKGVYARALHYYNEYLAEGAQNDSDSSYDEDEQESGDNPMTNKKQTPLNRIFYGPPGTGKTYGVVEAALRVIDGKNLGGRKERGEQMERFKKLQKAKRIAMVTFHQNFAYEDFIEGIKPKLAGDSLSYVLENGIFKEMALLAGGGKIASGANLTFDEKAEEVLQLLMNHKFDFRRIPQSLQEGVTVGNLLLNLSEPAMNQFVRQLYRFYGIRLLDGGIIGVYGSNPAIDKIFRGTKYASSWYETLKNHPSIVRDGKKTTTSRPSFLGGGSTRKFIEIKTDLRDMIADESNAEEQRANKKPYVLIIDEINRGNVSAIFGELITLLEEDKRLGRENALRLTLPYSKKHFGVPDNLHIIGTMNTADRSIALLDTALRRRFHFVEMMPDPQKAADSSVISGIDCGKLLEAINERIRFWYDREHQIGHAYLMNLQRIEELKAAFQQKIIPLLQEYFFDDWEKIDLVLNKNGFIEKKLTEINGEEKTLYSKLPFGDDAWGKAENYQEIYKKKNLQADDE